MDAEHVSGPIRLVGVTWFIHYPVFQVLHSLSDSLTAIVIDGGAHHLDLRLVTVCSPP